MLSCSAAFCPEQVTTPCIGWHCFIRVYEPSAWPWFLKTLYNGIDKTKRLFSIRLFRRFLIQHHIICYNNFYIRHSYEVDPMCLTCSPWPHPGWCLDCSWCTKWVNSYSSLLSNVFLFFCFFLRGHIRVKGARNDLILRSRAQRRVALSSDSPQLHLVCKWG